VSIVARRRKTTEDAGQAEVQATFDEAEDQGFFGAGTEGKDRDKFTVEGVTGATDTADRGTAANGPRVNPNAGAPGEPLLLAEDE
jgi:uncharacterized protein YbjT (DUF2867 family)